MRWIVAVAAILVGSWSGPAYAQLHKKHEPVPAKKKQKKSKGFRKEGDYFVLEDIKIEGKVYKPEAFHVINRKELSLDWDLGDPRFGGSFLSKLIDSVKRSDVF